jgi:hypothetical protein
MNINASIVDQRLASITENIREQAESELHIKNDQIKLRSLAFVQLCVKTTLDLDDERTFDCLTEGGGDFGVDAMYISDVYDDEFTVSLFQAKYKNNLKGDANFPEAGIKSLINAIRYLFDPTVELQHINKRLLVKVEEARSLIRDGNIPQIRAIACSNGLKWNESTEEEIGRAKFGGQVTWEYINHDSLIAILQTVKSVNDSLKLSGKVLTEDMEFSRILVGRISVSEIAALIERHGERLLERNIRRYLGLQGNRVNERIQSTLTSSEKNNFYFYNNGVTFVCDKFSIKNEVQSGDHQIKVENLQIINGGQTCMTIYRTLQQQQQASLFHENSEAYVLLRLYQLPRDNDDLVQKITYATNSQNPVELRDLHANDELQRRLELDIEQLGFNYHRKRGDVRTRSSLDITSGAAAEAVLSVWRECPHQAKFLTREHFGKLYDQIFTNDQIVAGQLNGSQVILAVLLYRISENRRKRPEPNDPDFVRYASCFIAMQMGRKLLRDMNVSIIGISHQNFQQACQFVENNRDAYFSEASQDIKQALHHLYGSQNISLQQLSATFRRGDLIGKLRSIG